MSKALTTDELKDLIANAIESIKGLFYNLVHRKENKKASLIAYWAKDYANYIENEDSFESQKLIKYKRGDVLSIEFGFRIGSELGGRHYAVVIDNNNSIYSDVITVVPLSSLKPNYRPNKYTFILKRGLYNLYRERVDKRIDYLSDKMEKYKEYSIEKEKKYQQGELTLEQYKKERKILLNKEKEIYTMMAILKKHIKGLDKLKFGTVMNVSQVITVSKMRIVNPKTNSDSLYKVRLHKDDLDRLNKSLTELYIFSNNS